MQTFLAQRTSMRFSNQRQEDCAKSHAEIRAAWSGIRRHRAAHRKANFAWADLQFSESTLRRYHVEIEFQKVLLAGDNQPFLAPKQVTAKLETNKGSLEITSVYEAKDASSHQTKN